MQDLFTQYKTSNNLKVLEKTDDKTLWVTQSSYAEFISDGSKDDKEKKRKMVVKRCSTIKSIDITEFEQGATLVAGYDYIIKTKLKVGKTGAADVVLIPSGIFLSWLAKDNFQLFLKIGDAGVRDYFSEITGHNFKIRFFPRI